MRNLKKILALVLALVMSLSLMATAGAADFTDASDINEKYETAIEVLEGLGVFKGYQDGTFQPTGSITRAETAAIIYRIVTGDVKDEQVGIYADYNLFSDVPSTSWFAGYVNYCANAEYIKGDGNGKFSPNDKVEGYAALAMILRAIGYTANGGFTGSDWRVQTARVGEARKITKNILTGTLGQPATRETVAEILFQAILVNMVDHNVDNTFNGNQGYSEIDMTLGYKTFKLEEIEGVVVANEFADLYGEVILDEGRTNLETEDEIRSLAISTEITDIGESRYAYITGSEVLAMGDTGLNKVTEYGHASDISTTSGFNAAAEMPAASDIQYYQNFGRVGTYDCDQRIEFVVTFQLTTTVNGVTRTAVRPNGTAYTTVAQIKDDFEDAYVNGWDLVNDVRMTLVSTTANSATYSKIIRAEEDISRADLNVIRGIFAAADNNNTTATAYEGVEGDVFVGTYSNAVVTEERDLSNSISYRKFFEEYINDITYDRNWNVSFNGDWVKFVDNDGDGSCDYAFLTTSFLDEAIATYTNKAGDTVLEYNWFDDDMTDLVNGWHVKVRYLNDAEIKVGDKVVASLIDDQILVAPAEDVTKTVQTYSWRDDEITTTDGETYGQSGIVNYTDMQEELDTMDEKTEYIMYLDHFGYVRAYELPGGTRYALVTELYYNNGNKGNLVQEWPMTVELTMPNADGVAETNEYTTSRNNPFNTELFNNTPWLEVQSIAANRNYYNWLQPAISHLGVTRTDTALGYLGAVNGSALADADKVSFGGKNFVFWPDNYQVINEVLGFNGSQEFRYGEQTYTNLATGADEDVANTTSFTNVAIVNGDDTVTLKGAAELKLNKDGSVATRNGKARYAVDYIQLATTDIAAKAVRYPIAGSNDYIANNNVYVNAVHDTQYYIVYNGDVLYVKDFDNFPGLTNEKNNIHAAYAVARDISADNNDQPYWVADVIVYEVEDWDDTAKTSVSLAYYTNSRTTGSVQLVKTLNSKYGPMVDLTPGRIGWAADRGQWGAEWSGYGFYTLNNDTEPVDGVMTARSISRIVNTSTTSKSYAANDIHAGIVTREAYVAGNGLYIDVDMIGNGQDEETASVEITDKVYSITQAYAQSGDWYAYNEAELLRYNNINTSEVKAGDMVIWVGKAATNRTLNASSFVVDLGGYDNGNYNLACNTASFLFSRTMDGTPVGAGNNWNGVAPLSMTNNGEWQMIMWEQLNGVDAADTYTVTLTGTLTSTPVGAGSLDDAIKAITVDGKTPTYKNGVWTVKVDQGKLSYPVSITLNDGYRITGITPNADSRDTVGVTFSTSNSKNENATLNIIGKANLNVAITYSTTTLGTDQAADVAAAKAAANALKANGYGGLMNRAQVSRPDANQATTDNWGVLYNSFAAANTVAGTMEYAANRVISATTVAQAEEYTAQLYKATAVGTYDAAWGQLSDLADDYVTLTKTTTYPAAGVYEYAIVTDAPVAKATAPNAAAAAEIVNILNTAKAAMDAAVANAADTNATKAVMDAHDVAFNAICDILVAQDTFKMTASEGDGYGAANTGMISVERTENGAKVTVNKAAMNTWISGLSSKTAMSDFGVLGSHSITGTTTAVTGLAATDLSKALLTAIDLDVPDEAGIVMADANGAGWTITGDFTPSNSTSATTVGAKAVTTSSGKNVIRVYLPVAYGANANAVSALTSNYSYTYKFMCYNADGTSGAIGVEKSVQIDVVFE